MRKTAGLNRHQKAARRPGEGRVGRDELPMLLEQARSADVGDRLTAAEFLCPCHVRRRVEAVWAALYGLMEDPEPRVRRQAWHTRFDGGRPDDPAFDAILDRALAGETDRVVRNYAEQLGAARREKQRVTEHLEARGAPRERGKCDFCARTNVLVFTDYDTPIPAEAGVTRPARICDDCARRYASGRR
jgi:hypothetical protein